MIKLFFHHKTQLSHSIWELHFTSADKLLFTPGQYVDLYIESSEHPKTFTITSSPNDKTVSFTIKFPDPMSDYKQSLLKLRPGDQASISEPKGDFVLPRDPSRHLIFVAGGLGIASYVSMLKQLNKSPVSLLYSHKPSEILYQDIILSNSNVNQQETISPNRVKASNILSKKQNNSLIYLSGSEDFTIGLRNELISSGINPTLIIYDYFSGYEQNDF